MAPDGACGVAQSTARSNAQFEAERFRKGFRRKNKHDRKCFRMKKKHDRKCFEGKRSRLEGAFEGKRSMLEQCFRTLSGLEARSSNDFERSVAPKHARAVISSAQSKKQRLCSVFEGAAEQSR